MKRRHFIQNTGALLSLSALPGTAFPFFMQGIYKNITIVSAEAVAEKEPLAKPFGFKGGFLTEIWQSAVKLKSKKGTTAIGIGTQSVLWSDSRVFAEHSEPEGNELMFSLTKKALEIIKGRSFNEPISLLEDIVEEVHAYGKKITGKEDLRKTFTLNALVAVDNAAWVLFARENGFKTFDAMLPEAYRQGLANRHSKVAYIPLISYNVDVEQLKKDITRDGSFFIKIKMGQPGTQEEMVEKDKAFITRIQSVIGDYKTPHTESGKLMYYFDANGRYESKDAVKEFIAHTKQIGAFEQIALLEEPFPESLDESVSDLGVRVSADESAHTDEDVAQRIQMGYTAIALKPIAKTLSMTLKMVKEANKQNVPCFCADLTVNPILVEWNKNIAARLAPLPGMKMGVLETNGEQNYKYWDRMSSYSPSNGASWTTVNDGVFTLNDEYYRKSGGVLSPSAHYNGLFK